MKISLSQQIDEVRRELAERESTYPRLVASGKLRQSIADYQMARLMAVFATLRWLCANEAEVRAAVEAANPPQTVVPDTPYDEGKR